MQDSDIPTKFSEPFAVNAGPSYIRPIPSTSIDDAAASLNLGFPPNTATPVGAGGTPPNIADFNGILNQLSAWAQWLSAGGPIKWDSVHSADIGGYPKNALVQSATTSGLFWFCLVENNVTDPDAGGAGWLGFNLSFPPGVGCYLKYNSATSLQLIPQYGGKLWINGLNYEVPASLTINNTGQVASAALYVYAYMSAGTMALELSTTGYTLASNGIPQKTGDITRTCVGFAKLTGATPGAFQPQGVGTLSYFNRRNVATGITATTTSTGAAGPTQLSIANIVTWADEAVAMDVAGAGQSIGTPNAYVLFSYFDGTLAPNEYHSNATATSVGVNLPQLSTTKAFLTEGAHTAAIYGAILGGGAVQWTNFGASIMIRG